MAALSSEHRFQMRMLFVLSVLGALVALAFSQSAGLFNPPAIVAAGAQVPGETPNVAGVVPLPFGQDPGPQRPAAAIRTIVPSTAGTSGAQRSGALDDGLGGPINLADATGALPPSFADDLAGPPPTAASSTTGPDAVGGETGPGFTTPGTSGPGASIPDTTGPGTGGPGTGDPGAGGPGTGGPGTGDPGTGGPGPTPDVPTPTSPVPEPATWLILIVGVAIVGGALRRPRPEAPRVTRPAHT